jgi:GH15 family glucan-1,4-alpha-glucosidase
MTAADEDEGRPARRWAPGASGASGGTRGARGAARTAGERRLSLHPSVHLAEAPTEAADVEEEQAAEGQGLNALFPPIAEYAFLSDCENSCLVAPTGAVEWLCLPRPHDPSIFGTILDRAAGSFRLGPTDTAVPASRRYLPGTNVLESAWQTRTGWLIVQDLLVVAPWHRTTDRSSLHRRTPGDYDAQHILLRVATCFFGAVEISLDCQPAFEYGSVDAAWEYAGPGYTSVRTTNPDQIQLWLSSDLRFGIEGRSARARHRLAEGESCFVALSWSERPPPEDLAEAEACVQETEQFWRRWLGGGTFPDHPWRERLQRSALTLKGLSYASTGALLAAPTTSLPEWPGGGRNWDYRYTWVRDAAFALWGLHALGFDAEADDFLAFLAEVIGPVDRRSSAPSSPPSPDAAVASVTARLQVLYGVDGTREVPERELGPHLSGYAGSRPVRVGNAAYTQEQSDIYGHLVDCVYQHTRSRDELTERSWWVVVGAVESALASWRLPDRGIWEVRGEPCHFTSSKVMCWVAANRGALLAALRGDEERATRWSAAAAEIHADVLRHGVDASGRFTQCYGRGGLDASLLLVPLVRFLPPDDERVRATVLAIADELSEDGMIVRYCTDTTDDGLKDPEMAFTACSFWLVSALVEVGMVERAAKLCERLLGMASDLGLYAEELDPTSGRHFGNFPQALTHLSLVNAVMHVIGTGITDQWARHGVLGGSAPGDASAWWDAPERPRRSL